jgi:EAL domain-containing protein (putative c-di-GMP-specific phosphodiesterase class I)
MDMFFFRNRLSTEKEKHIAVNVLKLLSKLNVEIVCEGIEDENTVNVLGHITHDFVIQGYYISKPIPIY